MGPERTAMAKKAQTVFVCQECGYESAKWMGQCICGAWNTFVEERVQDPEGSDIRRRGISIPAGRTDRGPAGAVRLTEVRPDAGSRMDTGIGELNRVLGGGIVKGSLALISGEPGIGKSTMILQAAAHISQKYGKVLYVSGEESKEQIRMRADRVCPGDLERLYLLSETNLENILPVIREVDPVFLVIDSIQTLYSEELDSAPGSVSQVRLCGSVLMNIGKTGDLPIFIVAHVTKSGDLAGPKIVEHLVDAVLQFNGERHQDLRILRAQKNRFGTTQEIGAFQMRQEGLAEIDNLSGIFLEGLTDSSDGAAATAVYEGTRPLLLEIQALTAPTNIGFARRSAIGIDNSRLNMIIAVLERKAGLSLINRDVYVNVVGGLKPEGTSTDLAVALAIWSNEKGIPVPSDLLALGEIGLTGDLRPVQHTEKLITEAARMGFRTILLPRRSLDKLPKTFSGVTMQGVTTVSEAVSLLSRKS